MKSITDLYGRHEGSDIYVVGTGPSLRVFPPEFLEGRISIGLNLAWKTVPVTYGITIHPALNIPEFLPDCEPRPEIIWATKVKFEGLDPEQVRYAKEHCYFFRTDGKKNTRRGPISDHGRVPQWLREPTDDYLYLWTSVAQAGVNLAVNMGARNVIVIGCDNTALGGDHHATSQHTRWLGFDPAERYREYYDGLAEARAVLRERNVTLLNLNPFMTLDDPAGDFRRLCEELDVPMSVTPGPDISPKPVSKWRKATRQVRRRVRRAIPR